MADQQNPPGKAGVIVRADFGQGVDQSTDYWRSAPGSMASVVNGRLDRVGNIRKRFGYQATTAAASSPGAPIGAWSADGATAVIDTARDSATDTWFRAGASRRIADESGYVARSYAPAASDPWRTIGPASDVIGDVKLLDGNLGTVDDTIDMCADDALGVVFIATVTKNVAAGGNTTITLTQYDRGTTTVLSVVAVPVAGETHLYPKMLIQPSKGSILIATCHRIGGAGLPGVATIDFRLFNYTASGATFVGLIAPTAVQAAVDYWDTSSFNSAAGAATSNSIYRPHCPFDLVKFASNTDFVLATYTTAGPFINLQRFTLDTATIVPGAVNLYKPTGLTSSLIALSVCSAAYTAPDDTVCLVGAVATIPATATNGQIITVPFNSTTLATRHARELYTHTALSSLYVGRLTCVQYKISDATQSRFVGFVELLEAGGNNVFAHRLARVGMSTAGAVSADALEYFSSATPTTRAFSLAAYYPTTTSTGALPVRLGLAVGASIANPVATTGFVDNFLSGSNYPPSAGTFVVAGTRTGCLSCIGTPELTRVPTMVPQAPPNYATVGGVVSLPHLVSTDAAGGFGIGLYGLSRRAAGDADGGVWASMPVIAGGVVQQVDGERLAEITLADRPKLSAVALSNAGAVNSFIAGSYLLYAVAVYRDSRGLVHRSTPSDPYRLTVTTLYRVWTAYVSAQQFTNRDDVAIEIYVTEANGAIPRLWQTVPNTLNQTGIVVVPFYDSAIAAPLGITTDLPSIANAVLYTAGGALPFVPVPSARFAFTHRNRLVTGGADDARNVYYSTEGVAYRGASFAIGQLLRLEEPGGCTAASTLNDKIVLFSASNCYVVYGQFPDASGNGNALAGPENLHDQLGCTVPTSLASIGSRLLWWASDRRIWIMDAQLAVQAVGLRVQDFTTPATTCNATIHVKDQREVRWYFTGSPNAQALVYNYAVDQWSTDQIKIASTYAPILGACISDSLGPFVVNGNGWAAEAASTWKDDADWITLGAATNWIEPGGTQDYARMRYCQLLARWKAPHNLAIYVFSDFDEVSAPLFVSFANAALLPVAGTVYPEQVKFQIAKQKTQAVKISIVDSNPGGDTTGQGPELIGLALDLLPLGGVRRLPVTRKG